VKRRFARNIVGIWLALGIISCAPITLPGGSGANGSSPATLGSSPSSYSLSKQQPDTHFTSNAPIDDSQSTALTNYLHSHQLPLVGARVLASNSGPRQAILYGYVATPFGRADAIDKARQWLNDSGAQIDNRITIEPDLAPPGNGPDTATAQNNSNSLDNPDLQKYQNQQNQQLTQQQQQYMNQGSPFGGSGGSPLTMFLPLLGFGFGGGGSGIGLGGGMGGMGMGSGMGMGGGMGGMGSPMGSPYGSPYGSPGGYPPSGYGNPYGP
jgi:hypothetical protein